VAAHLEWGYAGRVDLVATLRSTRRPTVIDFKTQKTRRDKAGRFKPILHDTWPLQLEAYRQALASKDKGLAGAAIASVVIGSTEPVPVVVKVWDDADKAGLLPRLPRRPRAVGLAKNYCPVKDAPDDGDENRRPVGPGRGARLSNPKAPKINHDPEIIHAKTTVVAAGRIVPACLRASSRRRRVAAMRSRLHGVRRPFRPC
jgi:hypothetical protein